MSGLRSTSQGLLQGMIMTGVARPLRPAPKTTGSIEEIVENPALERKLDLAIALAGARLDEPVGVAGPGALDLMCALWRRGFQRVEAARRCTCGCADEVCDLILVSGRDEDAAMVTIDAVSGMLRRGGRLVIIPQGVRVLGDRQRLQNLLAHRGFRYRMDRADGPLIIATKPDAEDFAPAPGRA